MIESTIANDRYCAVAHTTGRPHTASIAATAAPSPLPPKRKRPRVAIPSVIGRYQRFGLWVGLRPRNSAASIVGDATGGPGGLPVPVRSPRHATGDRGNTMTDTPWQGDACSLVDAFRAGDRSPAEELDATIAAIDASELNAFSFLDPALARAKALEADVSQPFGGVPFGVKELSSYQGWPATEASLVFADRLAGHTETALVRAERDGGVVPVGLTTASEFGGLNVSITKLNGVTHNPVAARSHRRRVVGRQRRRGGRWARDPRLGRGRRRVDPHPGRVQRPTGHEGQRRPAPARTAHRDPSDDRRGRRDVPIHPRHLPLLRRGRRPRLARPVLAAQGRGLGASPGLAPPRPPWREGRDLARSRRRRP